MVRLRGWTANATPSTSQTQMQHMATVFAVHLNCSPQVFGEADKFQMITTVFGTRFPRVNFPFNTAEIRQLNRYFGKRRGRKRKV